MLNKTRAVLNSLFWIIGGIFIGFLISAILFIAYNLFMPSYPCTRTVVDKKIISRISGKIFYDDETFEIVSFDDYARYAVDQEVSKTCRSWWPANDKRRIKKQKNKERKKE